MAKTDKMYTIFPARLMKVVAAAKDQEFGAAIESLMLARNGARQTITATNGNVLVSVTVPADRSLFESGQSLILPRDLVNAVCKTPIKADTDVEIVDTERVTQANLPSGLAIEYGRMSAAFPDLASVCKSPREDVTIAVSAEKLRTVLKALTAAMPDAVDYTFKMQAKKNLLYITASDDVASALAIVSGAETFICEVPAPPQGNKELIDPVSGEVTTER